jgi:hypothetical protein
MAFQRPIRRNSAFDLFSLELKRDFAHSLDIESVWSRSPVMIPSQSRRGRPKGTGIDDSDRIARLIELIRVHPELKPTTAIRVMGFSDPSAIRRLRDKYKAILAAGRSSAAAGALFGPAPARTALPAHDLGAAYLVRPAR